MRFSAFLCISMAVLFVLNIRAFDEKRKTPAEEPSSAVIYDNIQDNPEINDGIVDYTVRSFYSFQNRYQANALNGAPGTAGDNAVHEFHLTGITVGDGGEVESVIMEFPSGYDISAAEILSVTNDAGGTIDRLTVAADGRGTDSLIFTSKSRIVDLDDVDMTIKIKGIINDITLFKETPAVDGRFYVDTVRCYFIRDGGTGYDIIRAVTYLQSGQPKLFKVIADEFTNSRTLVTGESLGKIKIWTEDAYGNIPRDTSVSVQIEAVYYNTETGANGIGYGQFIYLGKRPRNVSFDLLYRRSVVTGNIILGPDSLAISTLGYTEADTIKLKVSYDDQYGYAYDPTAVTEDRSAKGAKAGYTENYAIIGARKSP